jgi:hypothetical protein
MNSAAIKESSGKSVEELQIPGLCNAIMKHTVKETEASFDWQGPKITTLEWAKMMAFFEWTWETEKSEAQVRWYVHPTHGWRCWAFPQKGGTSMTTKEIEGHPKAIEQRAQFPSSDGWLYFMTVHHHCAMTAFQSGTDANDEKGVDGIHITIGKVDEPKRDIHIRMYLRGHRFDPRMQFFWDVGQQFTAKAEECFNLFGFMPDLDKLARSQMALSFALLRPDWTQEKDGDKFPAEWKENYIVDRPLVVQHTEWQPGQGGQQHWQGSGAPDIRSWCYHCQKMADHTPYQCPENPINKGTQGISNGNGKSGKWKGGGNGGKGGSDFSLANTLREIIADLAVRGYQDEDAYNLLEECLDGTDAEAMQVIYTDLLEAKINREDMAGHFRHLLTQVAAKDAEKQLQEDQKEAAKDNYPTQAVTGWEGYTQ